MSSMSDSAEQILREFWARLDRADWTGMSELLDPGLTVHYLHNGQRFDSAQAFVRFNAEYPGRWRATVLDLVAAGDRAVTSTRISADDGSETQYVTSFATIRDGRVSELTELWADGDQPGPADRRPV
jgi:ketosteroid isomerase-like protein